MTLVGPTLDGNGLLMDFAEIKKMVTDVIGRLDHRFLNEVPPFDALNPSTENIAKYFCNEISVRLPEECRVRVGEVKVCETGTNSASYRPGLP
jgi:6-pyruvoyltetrahydropterin/6-carboxytetrahydropterin synthase